MSMLQKIRFRWLLAFLVHVVLFQSARKLIEPHLTILQDLKQNETEEGEPIVKRVVLILIGGLRWDVYSRVGRDTVFYKELTGCSAICRGSDSDDRLKAMEELYTGVPHYFHENGLESVFSFGKVLYVGPPSIRDNIVQGRHEGAHCYTGIWENTTAFPYPRELDRWVLDRLGKLLADKREILRGDRIIVLYFAGLYSANIKYGPLSFQSKDRLQTLLNSLYHMNEAVNKHYNDSSTAFIMTSESGFSDKDSSRFDDKTVPFVAWGSDLFTKERFSNGRIRQGKRIRLMRISDIAPLVSSLLGIRIPGNSFGRAPLHCLKDDKVRAAVSIRNARQMSRLYKAFERRLAFGIGPYFSPVGPSEVDALLRLAAKDIRYGNHQSSVEMSQKLQEMSYDGIIYYREFEYHHVCICVLISLIGWILVTLGWVLEDVKLTPLIRPELSPPSDLTTRQPNGSTFGISKTNLVIDISAVFAALGILALLLHLSYPLSVIPSSLLPLLVIWQISRNARNWSTVFKTYNSTRYIGSKAKPFVHMIYFLIFVLFIDYPIVLNFLFLFAIVFSCLTDLRKSPKPYPTFWTVSSLPFLVFLHHRYSSVLNFPVLLIGAFVLILLSATLIFLLKSKPTDYPLTIAAYLCIILVVLKAQFGPPSTVMGYLLTWIPAALVLLVPVVGSSSLALRLVQVILCTTVHLFQLSLSFEPMAFLLVLVHLSSWLLIEAYPDIRAFLSSDLTLDSSSEDTIAWSTVRSNFYYLTYVILSFLAIGNSHHIDSWPGHWPSYLTPSSAACAILIVSMKSFPIILIINLVVNVIDRKRASSKITVRITIFAFVSFIQFLFAPEYGSNSFYHLIFILSLLAEPLSSILLRPSLLSKFVNLGTKPTDNVTVEPKSSKV